MTQQEEITRRRTFAVIAHPDAGKTTLTEKLLLFGGAIHVAGAVKSNKIKKGATFGLHGDRTPARHLGGHGRDGLRIQGLQDQHPRHPGPRGFRRGHLPHADGRRLGDHRHRRRQGRRGPDPQADGGLPHAPDPRDRLHQQARPPVEGAVRPAGRGGEGTATSACGRWPSRSRTDPRSRASTTSTRRTSRSSRRTRSSRPTPRRSKSRTSPRQELEGYIGEKFAAQLRSDVELVEGVYDQFDRDAYLRGELAPVFFGSAVNNFGVRELLECFVRIAPSPRPAPTETRHGGACGTENDRLRLQDPRQHGPQPPRPHRVPEDLFGHVRTQ